jgi:aminoglycoside 3-N-acetyltransferase
MKEINLFQDSNGAWVTTKGLLRVLEKVGATDARVLYIHSGISFGKPDLRLRRTDLLAAMYEAVASLGVPTLCVPTFTFSFCNGQDFCVPTSPSKMGAFNEYVRRLPEAVRSIDPLMSNALLGEDRGLVTNPGRNSIGDGCTFDRLHQRGAGVKFLFMGTTVSECFTYTHYVEERLAVPYRYNRTFSGRISDGERTWEDTWTLFVRYRGVAPATDRMLEKELLRRCFLRQERCGDSSVSCVAEPNAYETIAEHLCQNVLCYIAEDPGDRDTTFEVSNMVAL